MPTRTFPKPKATTVTRVREDGGSTTHDQNLEKAHTVSLEEIGRTQTFSIKVPAFNHAFPNNTGSGVNPESGEPYEYFTQLVVGGRIGFHIYGDPAKRGNKIRVFAIARKKTMSDGSEHLLMDLYPSDAERLDQEVKVYQNAADVPEVSDDMQVIRCLGKAKGALVLTTIDHDARAQAHAQYIAAKGTK